VTVFSGEKGKTKDDFSFGKHENTPPTLQQSFCRVGVFFGAGALTGRKITVFVGYGFFVMQGLTRLAESMV
jgi:hypothetical protein